MYREWKHFCYEPRSIRFACGPGSPGGKDLISGIKLPQFSSAAIPKVQASLYCPLLFLLLLLSWSKAGLNYISFLREITF